jgi:hypothetical protein
MPVRVVLDVPRQYIGRRLLERVKVLFGAALVVIGTLAWIIVVPGSLLVLAWLMGEDIGLEVEPGRGVSADQIVTVWGLSLGCVVFRFRGTGLRLVRGSRTFVLFLRRFGYTDATRAATFAITRTIGRTWRVVTLDDEETAPLGIAPGTKWFFRIGHRVSQAVLAPFYLMRFLPYAMAGVWVILGLEVLRSRAWEPDGRALDDVFGPYGDILAAVADGRLPFEAVRPDLDGTFAVLVILIAWPFVFLPPVVAAAPSWAWPLGAAAVIYISFSMDVIRAADSARSHEVRTAADIDSAVRAVSESSGKLVAPRLLVLRVASSVWRETVSRFARASPVALIDISEPSDNLIWEMEELTLRTRTRCLFIGQYDRVAPLADPADTSHAEASFPQLAGLLEWEEILAYTTDSRGMRRFSRALRGKLLSMTGETDRQAIHA